jgi:N4-gp56 family major capsid protein
MSISSIWKNCFLKFHDKYYKEKPNYKLDQQRLSGLNDFLSYAIVRSNSKVLEGGITRLPASKEVIKVTECRETEDELMRTLLESTAGFYNCVGGVNGDNPTEPTAADFDAISTLLQNADAEFIAEVIEGEMKLGTGPVRDTFFAMCSTRLIPRLSGMAGFIHKAQYPSQLNVLSAEYGSVGNVRFVLSSRGSVSPNASLLGADVYNIFVTGQESYTSISMDGENAKFIYHPAGWGDDPSELRQTCAWRFAHARAITNDAWLVRSRATL